MSKPTQSFSLYGGEVTLVYDDDPHLYWLESPDGERIPVPNVTDIVGKIDKSGALVPWAVNECLRFIESHWPPDNVFSESLRRFVFKEARTAHSKIKESAASIGKDAHKWAEGYIKHQIHFDPAPLGPSSPEALNSTEGFLNWVEEHHVKFLASEKKVYSRSLGVSGTLDVHGMVDGISSIIDLKTSNAIRKTYCIQVAAYREAHNEEMLYLGREDLLAQQSVILLLGKDVPGFVPMIIPEERHKKDFAAFLGALEIYRWEKEFNIKIPTIKKRNH